MWFFQQTPRPVQLLLVLALAASSSSSAAVHVDVMVQQQNDTLVTGAGDYFGSFYTIGQRVFTGSLLSNYRAANPGFFALAESNTSNPAEPLPADTGLYWDFLTMRNDFTVSNLFYWDGIDDADDGLSLDDVEFTVPDNELFYLVNNGTYIADASDQMVTGGKIDTTAYDGSMHKHPAYILDASDGSTPDSGVYMVSLQVRMAGLETSEPFFLLMGTSDLDDETLDYSAAWVEENIDMLTSPLVAGDYNGDGMVDLADFTVWRNSLGSTTNLAANGDNSGTSQGVIDAADYLVWKQNFGSSTETSAALGATSVPEPATWGLLLVAVAMAGLVGSGGIARLRPAAAAPQA